MQNMVLLGLLKRLAKTTTTLEKKTKKNLI